MSLASTNRLDLLQDRARMLGRARSFFETRSIQEVDVPILSTEASIDLHIELIKASACGKEVYLHSSPEYGMKKLLAEGIGDIYQLSHVFRDYERGSRHTIEFMMAEWYRIGFTLTQMIEETLHFLMLFLESLPVAYTSYGYEEAFLRYAGHYPEEELERDRVYAFHVEPYLGKEGFVVITDFPPKQAALARLGENGMAERFEIYYQGIELANGYHELTDLLEQRSRLEQVCQERTRLGKSELPVDTEFLEAIEKGLPDCCGVAVGFDRLMMLRHKLEEIRHGSCFFI